MTWDEWVSYHAETHFWRNDRDRATLRRWADELARLGYTALEMHAASNVVLSGPPAWRGEHFAALRAAADLARPDAPAAAARPAVCELCQGDRKLLLPIERPCRGREGMEHFWCDCVPLDDPCRAALPAVCSFAGYKIIFADWRERIREWAEGMAARAPRLLGAARVLAERMTRLLRNDQP